jgi:pimeloyl-ACP methyl ester carboxylesterase
MIHGLLDDTAIQLASGRRLAFTTWGEPAGGVVFYLHGTGHSRLFCPDPEATVRAGALLIAVDRPGVGGSDPHRGHTLADGARDLVELADHLGSWPDAGHLGVVKYWNEELAAIHPERCSPRTR